MTGAGERPDRPEAADRRVEPKSPRRVQASRSQRPRATLTHLRGCPTDPLRVEVTEHPDVRITVTRCLDCGAQDPPNPARSGPLAEPRPWHEGIDSRPMTETYRPGGGGWPAHFTDRSSR